MSKPRVTIEAVDGGGFVLDTFKPVKDKHGNIDYDKSSRKEVAGSAEEALRKAQAAFRGGAGLPVHEMREGREHERRESRAPRTRTKGR